MTFGLPRARACSFGAALLLSLLGAQACSDGTEAPRPLDGPPASAVLTDVDAKAATSAALGMMGVSGEPATKRAPEVVRTRVARLNAIGAHLLIVTETKDPGVFRRLSIELRSENGDRVIAAYGALRTKIAAAAESPEMRARVAADPLFQGALKPASAVIFQLRGMAGGGDDIPNLGLGANGKYGDDRQGILASLGDAGEMLAGGPDLATRTATRLLTLAQIDAGTVRPDRESRLGAYAATAGYPEGTVGNAVHRAIGTIYAALGTAGEERIGRVFNSPEARALYNAPVDSAAGLRMAAIEHRYWENVAKEDSYSFGGQLGSMFQPWARDWLQRNVFALGQSSANDAGADGDGGVDEHAPDTCTGKADGFYCSELASYSAYQCEGGSISGGSQCAEGSCGPIGSRASIDGDGQLVCR